MKYSENAFYLNKIQVEFDMIWRSTFFYTSTVPIEKMI